MKHTQQTIAELETHLQKIEAEAKKIKNTINCLCEVMGEPPKYEEIEEKPAKMVGQRHDEYYGRPLATVISEVLANRKTTGLGSVSLDEIYQQLIVGGFQFTGKNEGIKKRGLAISMGKNPKFHHLPNDTWGLKKWYPTAKETKEANLQPKTEVQQNQDEEGNTETSDSE